VQELIPPPPTKGIIVDGRIIFDLAFKNWDINLFMGLWMSATGGICKGGNKPPIFIKYG